MALKNRTVCPIQPGWKVILRLVSIALMVTSAQAMETQPNVLLIMTDDQGWGDIGSHGNQQLDTPTLDALAASGARFDRFFVSPVCAPTRASLLTGRHHLATGTTWVTHRREVMRSSEVTIAEALKTAGYVSGCFGKWHNGSQFPNHPNGQGFEQFLGFCGGAWNLYFDAPLERNGQPFTSRGYITDVLTDAAIDFMARNRERPFFCYVPYNAPHSPYMAPDQYFQKYKSKSLDDKLASVYGMINCIDDNVGRLLAKLDEWQIADDTIVVFLTDNGPNGERFNGGMRGTKSSVHEGGVRVPLFIRYPGRIEPNTTVRRIAGHIDLMPTILDLCGVPAPKHVTFHGRSLVPLLEGDDTDWSDRVLFTHRSRVDATTITPGAVRSRDYRLVRERNEYELYDMREDPGQRYDVAAQLSEITKRLAGLYEEWFATMSRDGFARPPVPVGYEAASIVRLAPSDALLTGQARFANSIGWTTDWITDWQSTSDVIAWDLDVVNAGRYRIVLRYACRAADVGAKIQVTAGDRMVTRSITKAFFPGTRLRPSQAGERWILQSFTDLVVGDMDLSPGTVRIRLTASDIPGDVVCDTNGILLERIK